MLGVVGLVALGLGAAGITSGSILWMVIGGLAALFGVGFLLAAVAAVVEKTPVHARYLNRARRHKDLDAEQAIRDYAAALAALPAKATEGQRKAIITEHEELCEQAGHTAEARADLQALVEGVTRQLDVAKGPDRVSRLEERAALQARMGDDVQARADRETIVQETTRSLSAAGPTEREALLVARAAAHERLGNVALGTRDRLDATYAAEAMIESKDFGAPGDGAAATAQLLGLDSGAFRQGYVGEQRKIVLTRIGAARTSLLEAGRIKAVGWCGKCRAPVELDGKLRCSVASGHGTPKADDRVFVMPEDVPAEMAAMNERHARRKWHLPLSQPRG